MDISNFPIEVKSVDEDNKASIGRGFRMLISHANNNAKKEQLVINHNECLTTKWKELKNIICTYREAHIECREVYNFFDKLISVIALIASFVTTVLLTFKDIHIGDENTIYITECIMSGLATLTVGLTKIYDYSSKREIHSGVVVSLRNLALETINLSDNDDTNCDNEKYNLCCKKLQESLGTTSINQRVRKKHGLDTQLF
jgi:hypothetical protein